MPFPATTTPTLGLTAGIQSTSGSSTAASASSTSDLDWRSGLYNWSQYGQFCERGVHNYSVTWYQQHECRQQRQRRGFERHESEQCNGAEPVRRKHEQHDWSK